MPRKRCVFVDRECTPRCMAYIRADGMCGIHAAIEGVERALKLVHLDLIGILEKKKEAKR